MDIWKGVFVPIRKHVVEINFIPEDLMDPENIPEDEEIDDAMAEIVSPSPGDIVGYFQVKFDNGAFNHTQHASGTYYYPATQEQKELWEEGNLKSEDLYGW
jgi:hypothetical protein